MVLSLVSKNSWLNGILQYAEKKGIVILPIVGKFSFEILMVHQSVLLVLYKLLDCFGISLPLIAIIAIDLPLVFLAAWILRRFCDSLKKGISGFRNLNQ